MNQASATEADADISTPTIALVGFMGSVLLFVIIIFLQIVYYQFDDGVHARAGSGGPNALVQALRSEQDLYLDKTAVYEQGFQKIPIEKAKAILIAGGPNAIKPIVPREPAPAPAVTAASTAAGTAAPAASAKPEATKPEGTKPETTKPAAATTAEPAKTK